MKRRIMTILRGFAGTALLAAALACPVMTSCDKYDDSALKEDIANIKNDVADLKSRIEAHESKLNSEIAAVKELINGKVYVTGADQDQTTKVWTIRLSDGTEFKVYPEYVPGETIVTYVVEDGVYYWGYFKNGVATPLLDAAGNKIPVVTEIPDQKVPQIRVNPETQIIEISIDGQNWVATDVKMPEEPEPVQPCQCLIADVWYSEQEGIIYFYDAQGNVVTEVPLMSEDNFNFGIKSGKVYLKPGASKDVELVMTAITDVSVLEKPDGWKVKVNDKVLSLTAPTAEAIESGAAEAEGLLKLHATTEDHKCIVSKIALVASEQGLIITIDQEQNVVIDAGEGNDQFYGFFYGAMPADEFNPSFLLSYVAYYGVVDFGYDEIYSIETSLAQLLGRQYPYEQGVEYIVWAAPILSMDAYGYPSAKGLTENDFVFESYQEKVLSAKFTSIGAFDATLELQVMGYDKYIVYTEKGEGWGFSTPEDIIEQMNSPWMPIELPTLESDNYNGSVVDYVNTIGAWLEIQPASEYMFAFAPYKEDKSYVPEDFVVATFATAELVAGGAATISVTVDEPYSYSEARFNVEASADTYVTWYRMFSDTQYAALAADGKTPTDDELIEAIVHAEWGCNMSLDKSFSDRKTGLTPDQKAYFAGVAITKDGKYGKLVRAEAASKAVVFNENIKVSIDKMAVCGPEDEEHANKIKVELSSTGGTVTKFRVYKNAANWSSKTLAEMEAYIATASDEDYYCTNATPGADGKAVAYLDNIQFDQKYNIAALAIDDKGNPSRAVAYNNNPEFVAELEFDFFRVDDPEYAAAAKPTVTVSALQDPDWPSSYDVTLTITPAAGSKVTYGFWTYASSMESKGAYDKILAVIGATYNNIKTTTQTVTVTKTAYGPDNKLYITWVDASGFYYEPIAVDITDALVAAGWVPDNFI